LLLFPKSASKYFFFRWRSEMSTLNRLERVQVTPGNLDYVAESIHEAVNKFQWPIGEIFLVSFSDSVADPGSGAFFYPWVWIRDKYFPDPGSQTTVFLKA
jgi:hypothetical protein